MTLQNCKKVNISISVKEREEAKALAKSKGMTLQGWLGQLVKRELKNSAKEISYGNDAS